MGDVAEVALDASAAFDRHAKSFPLIVQRLLLENCDPAGESVDDLRRALGLPARDDAGAAVAHLARLLPREACEALRSAVDAAEDSEADSVDGLPDHQVDVGLDEIEALVGRDHARSLLRAVATFAPRLEAPKSGDVRCFVRRYSATTRPWNPFHTDTATVTLNVSLCDDESFCGGHLLVCDGAEIRRVRRGEGDATVHSAALLHGVSRVTSGARYSLIVFVDGEMRKRGPAATKRPRNATEEDRGGSFCFRT
ncbi:hypothetical protein M885DRAFT_524421 [Pelagophyceae sp. CCMP2097]|nr:hypothetical protein M885DRAFT_524421 [Pelagophyceae sp. CCMP2097]